MNNIDWTPALATAFLGEIDEIEEIEKAAAAGFFANLGRSALRSGAKMLGGVSKKVGGRAALKGAQGPVRPITRKYTGNSMTDLAKFYGGKGLMLVGKNPRTATGLGALGTAAAVT